MSWKFEYIFLIVFSTLTDYFLALLIEKQHKKKLKILLLLISLSVNLGLLFSFKYVDFTISNLNAFFEWEHPLPLMNFLLPVGISFYTFQTLSYSIDVYFGRQKAERHLGYFALYVSFFPQLVAGPIERFSRLTPQFKTNHKLVYENFSNGFRLIIYGLFIKMVIADNISAFVDAVYLSPASYDSVDIATAILFYSFQIYADFYGYSLIAIGSARLMGINLMDNFKTPYLAKGIGEFWQRWHISLSTWFRDYVYFPLGGNRVKKVRWMINILIVFLVSGLWHGANWTFIAWGGLYGIVYLIENIANQLIRFKSATKTFSALHILLAAKTFILVSLIWVFFRSPTIYEAFDLLQLLFSFDRETTEVLSIPTLIWILLGLFIISDILLYNNRFDQSIDKRPLLVRWAVYGALIFSIIVFAGVENFPFIYFQF